MFTGLVDHMGQIVNVTQSDAALTLTIQSHFTHVGLGESIAIDGVCLSVTDIKDNLFCVDVSPETLACTVAAHWCSGRSVNCERALAVGDRLGGHFVTGHIDSTIKCVLIEKLTDYHRLVFGGVLDTHLPLLQVKLSVTIN